ncbi:MAG: aldo/keto reductase [Phycisphaera sp.]|nr:aldo/keto reductase [Phycisphaera sp.]
MSAPHPSLPVPIRPLGRTGLRVSTVGFGAFKIGRNIGVKYPRKYDLPDDKAAERILNTVLDMGINLIDTAPAYGSSEERIGNHIAHRRSEYILSTKVGETFIDGQSAFDFTERGITASVERSLARLKTDAVDILLIHSRGDDLDILTKSNAVPTLKRLRDEGKTRCIGMSGKSPEGAIASLDWADVVMVEFNTMRTDHLDAIQQAALRGVGVLVKKALYSGALDPQDALRFVLQHKGVSSAVVGSLNTDHLRANIEVAASV